jgi:hypothetical protein
MSGKDRLNHRTVMGAILGGAGSGGSSDESLADALERVSGFAPSLLDEYHAALVESFASGLESIELAESAVVLGLADLDVAEHRGLDVLGYGLWAARANQRDGHLERAVEIADLVANAGVLSPELTAIQGECLRIERGRRRRRDQELLYARRALSVDEVDEARKHLGRALEHDPSCVDASRMLESLLVTEPDTSHVGSRARIAFFAMLALALPIGAVSIAHVRTTDQYEAFERPVPTDLLAVERRIAELGSFAEQHPLWWGRTRLEEEVHQLESVRNLIEADLRERNVEADIERQGALARVDDVYLDARTAIEAGDPRFALEALEKTLAEGVPSAAVRARLRRDITAIRELLASGTIDGLTANDMGGDR